ncbi:JM52 [macacine gammaherpesvirus 11]|uniref:JM52 n=2 Tax=macacine gammaherpesvirus 11 TaxID=2560570 RepID=G9JMN0_9GAMA|nr:JM52 [Macaca fuscata rhadinovirus]AAT00029.1 JM52 [Macaca fuscata rhadinovirus]AEW87577.1 JM52 [Macaca fuscata rhadinovirus]AEW87747.1 JM52 [Macaca fuscata rhadinovirus]
MLQKDAKLIFISSSNSSDKSTSFLLNLKDAHEKMLNVVSYVCPDHKDDFNLQDTVVACPCYRLHIPAYITIDETVRSTTNLFLDGAFSTELMGDAATSAQSMHKIVSDSSLSQLDLCRVESTSQDIQGAMKPFLHVYIDPAYTNNTDASGTGIGAVIAVNHKVIKCILLGVEHFFLRDLTGTAAYQIASCAAALIRAIVTLHPQILHVNVAVEGNSSQDAGVAIATVLNEICSVPLSFLHHADKNTLIRSPIYMLGPEKAKAFESFIYALNSGTFSASQTVVSHTIKLSFDPVAYLIDQIKAIRCIPLKDGGHTYCAKQKTMSDDVLVATVMAHYMATNDKFVFKSLE